MSAAPRSAEQFLGLLRKSGLADTAEMEDFLCHPGALPDTAEGVAARLERDGLLTGFQARQLLQGKWRNFILGKYKVLRPIASGGIGRVLLAQHTAMSRLVALKVLPARSAEDAATVLRFRREGRAVASLDHPNIVRAYDMGQEGGLFYIALEYIEGQSFGQLLKQHGAFPVAVAAECVRQTATGLQHAHEAGWVHRDIKPDNLLLTPSGVVKVLDLGLARSLFDPDDQLTQSHDARHILGTLDYLAPEQISRSADVDGRCDVYSLGATFYALLTGGPPFGTGVVAQKLLSHLIQDARPVRSLRPEVPTAVAAVLRRMMAKDPAARYQTPAEVAEALSEWATPVGPWAEEVLAGIPQERPASLPDFRLPPAAGAGPPPPAPPARRPGRRQLLGAVCLACVALVAALAVALRWHGPWAAAALPPEAAAAKVGQEVAVEFKVASTGVNATGSLFFLNSRRPHTHPANFTIVCQTSPADGTADPDRVKERFEGKRVAVRGKVELWNDTKPQIRVTKIEEIRVAPGD
ncbi:MAG: serine/threonine-protein kinase [Gemmataceae bacterium]